MVRIALITLLGLLVGCSGAKDAPTSQTKPVLEIQVLEYLVIASGVYEGLARCVQQQYELVYKEHKFWIRNLLERPGIEITVYARGSLKPVMTVELLKFIPYAGKQTTQITIYSNLAIEAIPMIQKMK